MGGTDQMDHNVSEYRVKIRNNKWWWQIFTHLLSASVSKRLAAVSSTDCSTNGFNW